MPGSPTSPADRPVDRETCKDFREALAEKFDGGVEDLKATQKEQRAEARQDFAVFAAKTERAIGKIAIAHAELTGTVKANKEGVETISKRGWGLLVLVLAALVTAAAAAIFGGG